MTPEYRRWIEATITKLNKDMKEFQKTKDDEIQNLRTRIANLEKKQSNKENGK